MHTGIWGTQFWLMIHILAYNYPLEPSEEHQQKTALFYSHLLNHMIPCCKCQHHIRDIIKNVNLIDFCPSQTSLFAWTVRIHNDVNEHIGKPRMEIDDAKQLYAKFCSINKGWKCIQKPKDIKTIALKDLKDLNEDCPDDVSKIRFDSNKNQADAINIYTNTTKGNTFALPRLSPYLKYKIIL